MGSGSSSKKKYSSYEGPSSSWKPTTATGTESAHSLTDSSNTEPHIRTCDMCGEMRRTACLENGKWFCVACQLSSGVRPKQPPKMNTGDTATLRPQPQLRRGMTVGAGSTHPMMTDEASPVTFKFGRSMSFMPPQDSDQDNGEGPRHRLSGDSTHKEKGSSSGSKEGAMANPSPSGQGKSGRRRRRAKERAGLNHQNNLNVDDFPPSPRASANSDVSTSGKAKLSRSNTVGPISLNLERDNYKSAAGLRELKNGLREEKRSEEQDKNKRLSLRSGMGLPGMDSEDDMASYQRGAPQPLRKVKLPGGFTSGDRVSSLISRYRFGLLILELGHEGVVLSAARGEYCGGEGEDDVRLLVQFQAGHDWLLPLRQLCASSAYGAQRAAALPGGHTWGERVRSLVTYLNPPGGAKEVWLGDTGTVIGPGQTKGKIAVRFDEGRSDWNVWPTTVCSVDSFNEVVKQRLAGGFGRGDRVSSKGNSEGSRSSEKSPGAAKKLQLKDGEEGTVIGPGHASGWVLVHFDSDEKVWSLKPDKLRASASCI